MTSAEGGEFPGCCVSLTQCLGRVTYAARITLGFRKERTLMLDIIVLAIGLAFFALSVAYTYACDRL